MRRQEHPRRGRRTAPARLQHQPSPKPGGREPDPPGSGRPRGVYGGKSTGFLLGGGWPGVGGGGVGWAAALPLGERRPYPPATPWSRGRPFSNLASAMSSANGLAGRVAVVVGAGSGLG